MAAAAILARLLQYAAVSSVGGSSLFFLYGPGPARAAAWPRLLVRVGAALGVLGGVAWMMAQTASIGDGPADAWNPDKVWDVASTTGFGLAALVRTALCVLALVFTLPPWRGRAYWGLQSLLGLAATASFAWGGHGNTDEGAAGAVHLAADVLHLLAASAWIGALFVLVILLAQAGRDPGPSTAGPARLSLLAFSRVGPALVAALILSGLVNSWFLVGLAGLAGAAGQPYGQVLIAKLVLFALMLGLAAANRYVFTPPLEPDGGAIRRVSLSVFVEALLGAGVLALVSWLGTLAPVAEG